MYNIGIWFVFQVGFRSNDIGNIPYILWFASGLIPWFFFSEAWNSATNSLTEYSFLVKKVVFKVHILPLVKVISNLFVHIFFVVFLVLFFIVYGIEPQVYLVTDNLLQFFNDNACNKFKLHYSYSCSIL